jgi:predicted Zn-dependent protease
LKIRACLSCVSVLLLLLGGCASVSTQPPAEITTAGTTSATAGDSIITEPLPGPAVSENRAVIALLDRARLDSGTGQREAAGASLERAMRIEPRNPWLWHELAQLRLAQGQYAQAISIARKSISFAARDRRLQALNWRVIANARIAQGNPTGAEEAFGKAAELER